MSAAVPIGHILGVCQVRQGPWQCAVTLMSGGGVACLRHDHPNLMVNPTTLYLLQALATKNLWPEQGVTITLAEAVERGRGQRVIRVQGTLPQEISLEGQPVQWDVFYTSWNSEDIGPNRGNIQLPSEFAIPDAVRGLEELLGETGWVRCGFAQARVASSRITERLLVFGRGACPSYHGPRVQIWWEPAASSLPPPQSGSSSQISIPPVGLRQIGSRPPSTAPSSPPRRPGPHPQWPPRQP